MVGVMAVMVTAFQRTYAVTLSRENDNRTQTGAIFNLRGKQK